ncbi:hypothetical protein THAOC_30026 [Thalassiosira oceanica]|uniref:Uncharacterized protein n=1 Tax=Thalassiosira oceanica TaxID=159749 RepID=K0RVX7_THAOC|nr:hypothetical protein THAOC_30026 [Thalassiosira oceanica]|eukprot:EJK50867.1 hypothetical protein THAOC_30026 [Thalassiosira oceanica]
MALMGDDSTSTDTTNGHRQVMFGDIETGGGGDGGGSQVPRHRPLHRRSVSDTIASRIGGVLGADSDNGIEGSSAHWRTINSNARLRLATQASELNDGEVRGIIATPLDSDMATHMTSRKRILNLIHDEVDDFTDDFRQMLGLGISQDSRTGLADPRVSNQLQARSDSIASQIDEGDAVDIHRRVWLRCTTCARPAEPPLMHRAADVPCRALCRSSIAGRIRRVSRQTITVSAVPLVGWWTSSTGYFGKTG